MALDKRCTCEDDFLELFFENTTVWHPLKYASKVDFGKQIWNELITKENKFFDKYGYIDVHYDEKLKTYSRKKIMGRPSTINPKDNRITVRLSEEQYKILEEYCRKNNIDEKAEAVRIAIEGLLKKESI